MLRVIAMDVHIKFNTEKESIENLKKLVDALQQLIVHRGGTVSTPIQVKEEKKEVKKVPKRTAGGCRVVQFDEDMSDKMSQLLFGRRY